jgi:PAS domain S-box-containing protein
MHSLLERQLKKFFGRADTLPPGVCTDFIDAVNNAYKQSDTDRAMIERSLELSSQELLQANKEMRSLFAAMDDIILTLDAKGTYLRVVETSTHLLLRPVRDIVGRSLHQTFPADEADVLLGHVQNALRYKRRERFEYSVKRKDRVLWMEGTLSPLSEETVIWVARDVTERKEAETRRQQLENELRIQNAALERSISGMKQMQAGLIQSEKMASVGMLTAGIAHEINNPLAFVSSNLNRFQEYFDDAVALLKRWEAFGDCLESEPRFREALGALHEEERRVDLSFVMEDFRNLMRHTRNGAERIRGIVERLRGFSHLASPDSAEADLHDAIDETLGIVWNELKYKAAVRKQYGVLPKVYCNIGEIKQVFVNLFVNAAHAIAGTGEIVIATESDDDHVIVRISDTGCGIPRQNLMRVFDPFFTTKDVGKGTGLGLWISATIIQKHNGSISVDSTVGKGTIFTIRIPVNQAERMKEDNDAEHAAE